MGSTFQWLNCFWHDHLSRSHIGKENADATPIHLDVHAYSQLYILYIYTLKYIYIYMYIDRSIQKISKVVCPCIPSKYRTIPCQLPSLHARTAFGPFDAKTCAEDNPEGFPSGLQREGGQVDYRRWTRHIWIPELFWIEGCSIVPDMEYHGIWYFKLYLDRLNFPNNLELNLITRCIHSTRSLYLIVAVWQLHTTHVRTLKNVFGSSPTKVLNHALVMAGRKNLPTLVKRMATLGLPKVTWLHDLLPPWYCTFLRLRCWNVIWSNYAGKFIAV